MFWIFSALEAGLWLGWLSSRFGRRERVKACLIEGTRGLTSFAVLDRRLESETKGATKKQRIAAAGISRGLRFVAHTRAFDLAVLKVVQDKYSQSVEKVRLHLC